MRSLVLGFAIIAVTGCGDIERGLAPDIVSVSFKLSGDTKEVVEALIAEELCPQVEEKGYECDVQRRVKDITLLWEHDGSDELGGELSYCLKEDCPPKEEE